MEVIVAGGLNGIFDAQPVQDSLSSIIAGLKGIAAADGAPSSRLIAIDHGGSP